MPRLRHASLPSSPASYLGVYETGPPHTYQPVADFTRAVGKQPNLVGYYSGWGEPFQTRSPRRSAGTARSRSCRWIPPRLRLAIAAGDYDGYLRSYADSVRDFGQPVVIGFGHEMNAYLVLVGLRSCPAADVRGGLAAHRDAVPRPGRRQRHLAVDDPGG